jgi:hypothetical protein
MATKKSNNGNFVSNYIMCGVVAGYQSDNRTAPEAAAEVVKKALVELGANSDVCPAVCIYHTDWGCPVGGEPVGAFKLSAEKALSICEALREKLQQSTLSVCLPTEGVPTIGFTAEVNGNLAEVGAKWQESAAKLMGTTGTYVSGGLVDNGNGTCTMSAEANPCFVSDREGWCEVVGQLCEELGTIKPEFKETKYNYLQKPQG